MRKERHGIRKVMRNEGLRMRDGEKCGVRGIKGSHTECAKCSIGIKYSTVQYCTRTVLYTYSTVQCTLYSTVGTIIIYIIYV